MYHREEENTRVKRFFKWYLQNDKWFYPITGCLIVIFLYLLFSYAIINTDVDDAITSAVQAFLNGTNPYQEDVVEHFIDSKMVLGRYHYFPPDLLTYSLFYILVGRIFSSLGTYWFVPLHFILIVPGYWIVTQVVDWPHNRLFPFTLLLITPFLFTNSMLMWFFFLIGYYFYEKKEQHTLGMVFYVIAASVKYMVGFIILFYFIQSLRELFTEGKLINDLQLIGQKLSPFIVSSFILTLFCLPFGLFDVLTSVFIYQGVPQSREDVAQAVGPLLIEILNLMNLKSLYIPIATAIIAIALLLLIKSPPYDQIMHISFLAMIILPFYATELFIILPFYFWFKEGAKSIVVNTNKELSYELFSHPM